MIGVILVLVAMLAVIFAGTTQLLVAGTLTGDRARDRAGVRSAALDRLEQPAPFDDGGAVSPEPPVDGYTDVVFVTDEGRVVAADTRGATGVAVRRSWRVVTTPDGERIFEVSAELVEGDAETDVDGPGAVLETAARTLDR